MLTMCPNCQTEFDMNDYAFEPLDEDPAFDDKLEQITPCECYFVTRISPPLTKIRECRIRGLTGGSVTITNLNNEVVDIKSPRIEIRPKIGEEDNCLRNQVYIDYDQYENMGQAYENSSTVSYYLPSDCQELSGWLFDHVDGACSRFQMNHSTHQNPRRVCRTQTVGTQKDLEDGAVESPQEIRLSATLQFPANVNHCSVNITATRTKSPQNSPSSPPRSRSPPPPYSVETDNSTPFRYCNNFYGGGIVNMVGPMQPDSDEEPEMHEERLNSRIWVDHDFREIKKKLRMSGWYYDNISWQESAELLKNQPHGKWLLRDSRDNRYEFAISVQTSTGPTSIRIDCSEGLFRLDADPNLTYEVPYFDCIFKLIRYYIAYSKVMEKKRKVVWVDFSRRLYNQIYLSETPLHIKVPSLSHLARLCINRQKLNIAMLPPVLQDYCKEYPYKI